MNEPTDALADEFPELNPRNYDEADVMRLHEWSLRAYDALRAKSPPGEGGADWIFDVLTDVAELPDRDSPDDCPEAMLVTGRELRIIIKAHAPSFAAPPQAEQPRRIGSNPRRDAWEARTNPAGSDPTKPINPPADARTERGEPHGKTWREQYLSLLAVVEKGIALAKERGHAAGFAEAISFLREVGHMASAEVLQVELSKRKLRPKEGGR